MKVPDKPTMPTPPLSPGDRLTRPEFERRYDAMPHLKKAELINGTVHMTAATRFRSHGQPHSYILGWLTAYAAATPYVDVGDNATVRLDLDNEIQPDALLRIATECGGQSRISEDDYLTGPPELIAEVAASSAAYDLHAKKEVCRRHGVKEYVVWQIFEDQLDWFVLEDGAYLRLDADENEPIRSRAFPGLHLHVPALLSGKLDDVLATVQRGTDTDAHTAFVEQLEQQRGAA